MTTTIGSLDLNTFNDLYSDSNQYFWFESNSSSAWGSGAHVTLYPESQFTDSTSQNYMKGQNIIMNTDGLSIRNGALPLMVLDDNSLDFNAVDTTNNECTNIARFSDVTTIGKTDGSQSYLHLDFHSMQMFDYELEPYFVVSDLRDENGEYELSESFSSTSVAGTVAVAFDIDSIISVTLNGSSVEYQQMTSNSILITPKPTGTFTIVVTYVTKSTLLKVFTFGSRGTTSEPYGALSVAEGYDIIATGMYSHAEGNSTTASGVNSHAEGMTTIASGYCSHVEGYGSVAYGHYSHAGGYFTQANGNESVTFGYHTYANSDKQFVIGEYNELDVYEDYYFIIGNGSGTNDRSNAFSVDKNGAIYGNGALIGSVIKYSCSTDISLSNSYKTLPLTSNILTDGNVFAVTTSSDLVSGGIKCKYDGVIHLVASVRFADGFTANDYIIAQLYNYNNTTSIGTTRIRTPFAAFNGNIIIDEYATVSAGDIILLRAYNITASRGKVTGTSTTLSCCYIRPQEYISDIVAP